MSKFITIHDLVLAMQIPTKRILFGHIGLIVNITWRTNATVLVLSGIRHFDVLIVAI